jgi:hypothetical protein
MGGAPRALGVAQVPVDDDQRARQPVAPAGQPLREHALIHAVTADFPGVREGDGARPGTPPAGRAVRYLGTGNAETPPVAHAGVTAG